MSWRKLLAEFVSFIHMTQMLLDQGRGMDTHQMRLEGRTGWNNPMKRKSNAVESFKIYSISWTSYWTDQGINKPVSLQSTPNHSTTTGQPDPWLYLGSSWLKQRNFNQTPEFEPYGQETFLASNGDVYIYIYTLQQHHSTVRHRLLSNIFFHYCISCASGCEFWCKHSVNLISSQHLMNDLPPVNLVIYYLLSVHHSFCQCVVLSHKHVVQPLAFLHFHCLCHVAHSFMFTYFFFLIHLWFLILISPFSTRYLSISFLKKLDQHALLTHVITGRYNGLNTLRFRHTGGEPRTDIKPCPPKVLQLSPVHLFTFFLVISSVCMSFFSFQSAYCANTLCW